MFNTIKNALKTPDVRKRVLYTLLLIVIFRLGCFISVPAVDTFALSSINQGGITQLINTISGGAFSRFSIFAMSITPYITASIVIQLLAMIIPSLVNFSNEGIIIANNCIIIDAVIYGVIDIAKIDNLEKAPPEIVLTNPASVFVYLESCSANCAESTPGTTI